MENENKKTTKRLRIGRVGKPSQGTPMTASGGLSQFLYLGNSGNVQPDEGLSEENFAAAPEAKAEKPAKKRGAKSAPAAQSGDKPVKAKAEKKKREKVEKAEKAEKAAPKKERRRKAAEEGEKEEKRPRTARGRKEKQVKIIFLGGVGEIGKNMTAIEYGEDIIIIDAGIIFPSEELPGIDLVAPDISYLVANKHKVKGLLLTHGHEDHIGGVPYLLREIKAPVIGTKLTLALVDNKLREHRINDAEEVIVSPGDRIKLGCFDVLFVNVNHSIAGALALAIDTPQGLIFHSGDFKIDLTPVAGEPIDLKTIADLGERGVLCYLGESTNIERPGYTMSEKTVGSTLDRLFNENLSRRLIIATFASNVHRLQQIIDLAVKYKRKVALSGRSMLNVVDAAENIGDLHIPEGVLVDVSRTKKIPDSELVIVSTGSQGEPMSALTRMANGENPSVTVGENDTIIISASPIPGNEKDIYRVINNLYRKGANVVYESLENIHVSGHACREEHKIMHRLLKPKFFIPVHGEYRHLRQHEAMAVSLGIKKSSIAIAEIGSRFILHRHSLKQAEGVEAGNVYVDGLTDVDNVTLRDRKVMSNNGMVIVLVTVALAEGQPLAPPEVITRGLPLDEANIEVVRGLVTQVLGERDYKSADDRANFKRKLKRTLTRYFDAQCRQKPMILPIVIEV